MLKVLAEELKVALLGPEECTYRRMKKMQIVAFPGGVGEADAWSQIFHKAVDDVRLYVQKGGGYLGVCMGAYWAGPEYCNLIQGVQVERYIGRGEIRRSYPTTARVDWRGTLENMFFWDGPAFQIKEGAGVEVVARYQSGDPMALRQGRIGLIGCHPESQQDWYTRKYMRARWHGGRHGTLLREFVHTLCAR